MDETRSPGPITARLRQAIRESGMTYKAMERATGVTRASIMRFARGSRSLRLDMADRLAAFFKLELTERHEG
jgi:transcriptional regulator with XRE-family HTH domain